ncbi:MAG: molybdate ABC transporter substrate-binding protein [Syntrophotaleaceae bacterium]
MRSLLISLLLSLLLVSTAFAAEVRISVAASLTDAVKEIIASYEKKVEDVEILPNFASSGALAKQIVQGAPADLFISANPKWMNYLVEEKMIPADQVRILAFNSLVLAGDPGLSVTSLDDVAKLGRIAIGSPKSVPAGQYAEQALKAAGLFEKVQPKLVMAKDVRQALIYADRGEVDGAFVYRTDALLAEKAKILLEIPQELYSEVNYPIALTVAGLKKPEAVAFADYLKTAEAAEMLRKYGFVVRCENSGQKTKP